MGVQQSVFYNHIQTNKIKNYNINLYKTMQLITLNS